MSSGSTSRVQRNVWRLTLYSAMSRMRAESSVEWVWSAEIDIHIACMLSKLWLCHRQFIATRKRIAYSFRISRRLQNFPVPICKHDNFSLTAQEIFYHSLAVYLLQF